MSVNREHGPEHGRELEHGGGAAVYFWRFLVSALLFLLLWEWVRPLVELSHLTDLHLVEPLLIAIGSYILIDVLRVSAWLGWPLKIVVSLAVVGYFFHGQFIGELGWLLRYKQIVMLDVSNVLQGNFGLSAENRTFILLMGIACLTSVIQSLLLSWQMGGYFVVATFMYLLSLQWWAGVDTTMGIVRTFVFAMFLLMLLNMVKIQRIFAVSFTPHSSMRRWVIASLLVLLLTLGGGGALAFLADDEAPLSLWELREATLDADRGWLAKSKWVEQLRTFALDRQSGQTSYSARFARQEVGRSGYGGSDHRLGGKMQMDDAIVFIAPLEEPVYWRGESKIYYDGKGWADDKYLARNASYYDRYKGPQSAYFLQLPEHLPERIKQLSHSIVAGEDDVLKQVTRVEHYLKTSFTYNLDEVELSHEDGDFVDHFLFEQQLGYCDHFSTAMVVMLRTLGIPARWVKGFSTGDMMEVSYEELQQAISDEAKHGQPTWLEKVDVPHRTAAAHTAIGSEWAGGSDAGGQSARGGGAIETDAIGEGVQFNVVNSSVNDSEDADRASSVVVRNLHAHSWVEAYIPSIGWLAYEPTPGFVGEMSDSNDRMHDLLDLLEASSMATNTSDSNEAGRWSWTTLSNVLKKGLGAMSFAETNWQELWNGVLEQTQVLFVGLAIAIVVVVTALLFLVLKSHIALWIAIKKSQRSDKREHAAVYLFDVLWVGVFKRFGPIQPSQTIREYVRSAQVRKPSQRAALHHFAELYEAIRYDGRQMERLTKNKIIEAWKKI